MSVDANNVWEVPAYLPYLQPPLTDAAIALAEEKIGHKLPLEYLDLLRKQNGGYIRFSLPDTCHRQIAGIGPNFPSLTGRDWDECQEYVSFQLDGLVPFDGDGHWHLCFDFRQNLVKPSIAYVDIECDHESQLAGSFADYLLMLRLDIGNGYVLESVKDLDAVKSQITSVVGVEFYPPSSFASGYPEHRAHMAEKQIAEIWLSPNMVPRGFVRENDPRYEELKDLLRGQAARYPELPQDSYLISASDHLQARVVDACAVIGLKVRPLREYIPQDE